LVVLLALGGVGLSAPGGGSFPKARLAPLSREYQAYLEAARTGRWPVVTERGLPSSIPSPIDFFLVQGGAAAVIPTEPLPPAYDLRKIFKMTPVKNQSPLAGTSLFATTASLESFLKPLETFDFSENQLDIASSGGGFLEANLGALARWDGPVKEEDSPWYGTASGEFPTAVKHVQNVLFIPPRADALDNDLIKQAVMNYGAVYAEMFYTAAAYHTTYHSYYNPIAPTNPHAVAIAGWDDGFDKARFNPPAPGNGTFICKNSFGPAWGEAGYFYVSYYDAFLGRRHYSAAFTAEPVSGLTWNYQHDPNGCTARLGFDTEVAWFANVFTAATVDPLRAVSFYLYAPGASYDILVYKDPVPDQPRSGTLAARVTGTLTAPGYQTIVLPSPVPLLINQGFSIVVKLRATGDVFPIPLEHPLAGYNVVFTANPGESFISPDGSDWSDLATSDGLLYSRTNVCLKAFAGYPPIFPPLSLNLDRLVNDFAFFKEYVDRLTWIPNPGDDGLSTSVSKFRIYQKRKGTPDAGFVALGESSALNTVFYVRGLKKDDRFTYRVAAVLANGREGDPAEISNL
jgi:C1A family cysteine protease